MNKRTDESLNGRIKKREERNEWMNEWMNRVIIHDIFKKDKSIEDIIYIDEEFARLNKC